MPTETDIAIAALRAGEPILIPTDTVYGLSCDASSEAAVRRLYRLKGRDVIQPTAVVFASVGQLLTCVPELSSLHAAVARELLPGGVTLLVPNPGERYPWVCGSNGALGVRVPRLTARVVDAIEAVGPVVATSANLPGKGDPRRLGDVPALLVDGVGAMIDGGELPGIPSTVVDLTGAVPVIVREGAVAGGDVLAAVSKADPAR